MNENEDGKRRESIKSSKTKGSRAALNDESVQRGKRVNMGEEVMMEWW